MSQQLQYDFSWYQYSNFLNWTFVQYQWLLIVGWRSGDAQDWHQPYRARHLHKWLQSRLLNCDLLITNPSLKYWSKFYGCMPLVTNPSLKNWSKFYGTMPLVTATSLGDWKLSIFIERPSLGDCPPRLKSSSPARESRTILRQSSNWYFMFKQT